MIDITARIGSIHTPDERAEWPMYSYDRPAYILWNAIANVLHAKGWTEDEIKNWLQSKDARWALDFGLEESIEDLGRAYAEGIQK